MDELVKSFKTIALMVKPRRDINLQMHKNLYQWLKEREYQVLVEKEVGEKFGLPEEVLATVEEIGEQAQLVIVIGGDGNMLGRARILAKYNIPKIGINRGNLGFLTDIDPKNAYAQLEACLEHGEFFVEERFLLEAKIERNGEIISSSNAVNEAVIHPAKIAHMIDFHVYINDKFAFSQRSDGLIVSTPTGSTAYNKSIGGAVVHPRVKAMQVAEIASLNNVVYRTLGSPMIVAEKDTITVCPAPEDDYSLTFDQLTFEYKNIKSIEFSLDGTTISFANCAHTPFWERVSKSFIGEVE